MDNAPQTIRISPSAGHHERAFFQKAIELAQKTDLSQTEAITKVIGDHPMMFSEYLQELGIISTETATQLSEGVGA